MKTPIHGCRLRPAQIRPAQIRPSNSAWRNFAQGDRQMCSRITGRAGLFTENPSAAGSTVPTVSLRSPGARGSAHTALLCTAGHLRAASYGRHVSVSLQFQFIVLRLFSEARDPLCQEDTAGLPWGPLCLPATDWQQAALCLWKHSTFWELLTERELHVGSRSLPSSSPHPNSRVCGHMVGSQGA